jgi:L-fuconolactonase
MPNFPIVDTQVHLWDPQRFRMRGIEGNDILDQRYELDDYYEHTRGVEIEAMVYMEVAPEPNYELLEAQWAMRKLNENRAWEDRHTLPAKSLRLWLLKRRNFFPNRCRSRK